MEKVLKIFKNFKEAEAADREYWQNASYEERIYNMLYLQQMMLELFYPDVKRMEKIISFRKYGEEPADR
jgi:hypothetical protein